MQIADNATVNILASTITRKIRRVSANTHRCLISPYISYHFRIFGDTVTTFREHIEKLEKKCCTPSRYFTTSPDAYSIHGSEPGTLLYTIPLFSFRAKVFVTFQITNLSVNSSKKVHLQLTIIRV